MSAHRNLTEERARRRNLRDIADAERCQPRLRLGKSLDQVRTAKSDGDHRFAGLENLLGQRRLLWRHIDISFAVAHAHEERENCHVVGIRRRQVEHVGFDEPGVRAQRGQRIKARAQLAL